MPIQVTIRSPALSESRQRVREGFLVRAKASPSCLSVLPELTQRHAARLLLDHYNRRSAKWVGVRNIAAACQALVVIRWHVGGCGAARVAFMDLSCDRCTTYI